MKALKRNLKIISFSKKNKSNFKLEKIESLKNSSSIKVNINGTISSKIIWPDRSVP